MSFDLRQLTRADLPAAIELLRASCAFDDAHQVAEEKLFAPGHSESPPTSLGAFARDEKSRLLGLATHSGRWIRLLAVAPAERGRGVGTALLQRCEGEIEGREVRVMDEPGNYLSPGVDERNRECIDWLVRAGYSETGAPRENLLVDLQDNPRLDYSAKDRHDQGLRLCTLGPDDEPFADSVAAHFSEAWATSFRRALAQAHLRPPSQVFAFLHADGSGAESLAAFAICDGNNRGLGSFGPAGTMDNYRGQGLGAALLLRCCQHLRTQGYSRAEVEWIGPRAFYEKIVGVMDTRRFVRLGKTREIPKETN